ncbi:hypothetical protein H4Q26_006509 [Puccinia striiformis f. sp. tritici PST-130]|nr:hypothetical protein H4Q26_006509 [Puccinia striiformis f. sp. tritici PST-130]
MRLVVVCSRRGILRSGLEFIYRSQSNWIWSRNRGHQERANLSNPRQHFHWEHHPLGAGLIPGYWATFAFIDWWGRKPIQFMGFAFSQYYSSLWSGTAIINSFNTGRPIHCVLLPRQLFPKLWTQYYHFRHSWRMFPNTYRSTSHGISAASGKLGAIIAQVGFARLKDIGGKDQFIGHIFQIFAAFMFTGFLTTFLLPETKGKSLEELCELRKNRSDRQLDIEKEDLDKDGQLFINCDFAQVATSSTGGTKFSNKPPAPLPSDQQAALNRSPSQTIDGNQLAAKPPQAWKSFISGGFGGICAVLVGQPFDLTKTRLQTAQPGQYSGTMDVVRRTFAKDGVSGFYRGMSSPLAGVTPMFAVSFWNLVYSFTPTRTSKELSYSEYALAGGFSALPTTLIAAPIERIKVLLQVDGQSASQQKYSGAIDCVRQVYKEGGVKSIFRGSLATVVRDAPGRLRKYFVAYEAAKKALTPVGSDPTKLNLSAICASGGIAGIAMWSIAIPPDVIKSRLQSAPEGLIQASLIAAVPANAATFLGVELALSALNKVA